MVVCRVEPATTVAVDGECQGQRTGGQSVQDGQAPSRAELLQHEPDEHAGCAAEFRLTAP